MSRWNVIIFETLLWLAFAEGVARVAEWVHPPSPDLTFDYAPYRMLRMIKAPWPLNQEGFRAGELAKYKNSFLVEFVGGSVCLGVGTNTGETIPERLEDALHASGLKRSMVLNLCQGGATSAQELAIFIEYGLPLNPQVVLSFDGANDLMHPRPLGPDDAPNLPYENAEMQARFDGHHNLTAHLALVRIAARLGRATAASDPAVSPAPAVPERQIFASYEYALKVTGTLARSAGASYSVLFQPTLHFAKPWSEPEKRMWRARRPHDGAAASQAAERIYRDARGELARWSAAEKTPVFDLSQTFTQTDATIYSDSVHFANDNGYRMLFQELKNQGLVDRITERYRQWEQSN